MKRAKGGNRLEYNTVIEDRKRITNSRKPNMEGNHETDTNEFNAVIKKLKREKGLGPHKIPNEIFIEANQKLGKC